MTETAELSHLFGRIYDELRALASRQLRRERVDHTLQPTALVHEAYVKLSRGDTKLFENPQHFRAVAARVIRQVLVDHAAARGTIKRGGKLLRVTLNEAHESGEPESVNVLALDTALSKLAEVDARQSRIVELRYFGGLTIAEVANELEISSRTVSSEWAMARAWLAWQIREASE